MEICERKLFFWNQLMSNIISTKFGGDLVCFTVAMPVAKDHRNFRLCHCLYAGPQCNCTGWPTIFLLS